MAIHPYFQLTDSTRDEWTVSIGAKTQWLLAQNKVPTGETQPIETLFPDPKAIALKEYDVDHVFGDLVRDASGRAVMTVKGKSQQLDVVVGPQYRAMVVYAPKPPANPRQLGGESQFRLLRAHGRHHQRDEHGAQGNLQGAPEHPSRRDLG